MRSSCTRCLAYALVLVASCAGTALLLDVIATGLVAAFSQYGNAPVRPTLVERRRMEAASSSAPAESNEPEPVNAFSPPDVPAGVLAAELDAAESADAPLPRPASRRERNGRPEACNRACRLALERRLEALE